MRQAIVEILGFLIADLSNAGADGQDADTKQTQNQINSLFELLHERVLDNSGYVRAKVFNVLSKIVNIKTYKFPKYRLQMASHAAGALDDKLATVRKAAISLLKELLLTHPYGELHGGTLQREMWQTEYEGVVAKLNKYEGAVGNVVKNPEGELDGEEDEEEQEGGGDEDGSSRKRKKSKKCVTLFLLRRSLHLLFLKGPGEVMTIPWMWMKKVVMTLAVILRKMSQKCPSTRTRMAKRPPRSQRRPLN